MGPALLLLNLVIFFVSIVCLIRPIRAIGIPTRKRAAFILIASLLIPSIAAALLQPSDRDLADVAAPQVEPPPLKASAAQLAAPKAEASAVQSMPPEPLSQVDAADYLEECGGGKFDFCKGKTVVWDAEVEKIVDKTTVQARVTEKLRVEVVFRNTINPDVLDAGIRFRFAGVIASQGGLIFWETIKKAELLETFNTKADVRAEREAKAQAEAARKAEEEAAAASKMKVDLETYRLGESKNETAYIECQSAVKRLAQYGARSDWFPNYSWVIKDREISIFGKDVRMKNGFNAERYVDYRCRYDVDTGKVNVVSVD
jgi:hypothetical protein